MKIKFIIIMCLLSTVITNCSTEQNYLHKGKRGNYYNKKRNQKKFNEYYKIGTQYTIKGKTYKPRKYEKYSEIGIASWYGDQFHNKMTANGDLFSKYNLSAAHKTLPLPSIVRVTNLENNTQIIVKVNDRGPFSGDRIIDLSESAATSLGFHKKGLALVKIDYLKEASQKLVNKIISRSKRNSQTISAISKTHLWKNHNTQSHSKQKKINNKNIIYTFYKNNNKTHYIQKSKTPAKKLIQKIKTPAKKSIQKVKTPARKLIQKTKTPAKKLIQKVKIPARKLIQKVKIPARKLIQKVKIPARKLIQKVKIPARKLIQKVKTPARKSIQKTTIPAKKLIQKTTIPAKKSIQKTTIPAKKSIQKTTIPAKKLTQKITIPAKKLIQKTTIPAKKSIQKTTIPARDSSQPEAKTYS